MSDAPKGVLWTEKYRPRNLEDMALEEETRKVLQSYLDGGEIPHILMSGPSGSGKTTIARILMRGIDCQTLSLNASSERGIDVVRERIGNFVTASFGSIWNVVFLDEADAMTSDAQTALRNLIESFADRSRFILTCNYPHKIISPIRSRCQQLTLGHPPLKERYRILSSVLTQEGIDVSDPKKVLGYAEQYGDLRELLMSAQKAILGSGGTDLPAVTSISKGTGMEVLTMIKAGNWTGLRRLVSSGDFDVQQGLHALFYAVPDDDPHASFLRHIVGKAHRESSYVPDAYILFLGTCAELMEGMK